MAQTIPAVVEKDGLSRLVDESIESYFTRSGLGENAKNAFKRATELDQKFELGCRVWRNNGFESSADASKFTDAKERESARMSYGDLVDAMSTPDATILMPRIMTQVAREAIEPQLTLTPLLKTLRFTAGTSMTFPAMSAMNGVHDMGEGDEYPELMGPRFAGTVTAKMGKVGCAVRITEEMLRYSQWDIMSMLVQGAGKALARHKEVKVANQILDNARVSFDNDTPGGADNGATTGRDIAGAFNNTLRLDDLFVTYSDMINDGFIPNILIVNAAGWLIFARDPTMRAFNFAHSGPLMRTPSGSNPLPWRGAAGQELGESIPAADLRNTSTLFTNVPGLFPVPLQVIVSPFITYTAATKKTDLIMADKEELGLMVVDEEVVTDQFDDPMRDIRRVKFRERYGFCILNEGQGIRKIANVSTNRGYDFEDTKANWDLATAPLPS